MKKKLFFMLLCAWMLQLPAQNALSRLATSEGNAPVSASVSQDRNSTWISWASEAGLTSGIVNTDATDPFDLMCAQRFSTSDLANYDGLTLTQVAFYLWSSSDYPAGGTYTVRIYKGGSYSSTTSMNPGTLVSTQTVNSIVYDDWSTVTLSNPVTIDASQELWICVYIANGTGLLMSYDVNNTTTGKGTLYYDTEDQQWYDINAIGLSFTVGNWGIKGYVYDPNNNDPVIDLGLWFIDDINNQNEITSMTVPYGSSFLPIPVVYNFNYGDAVDDFYDTLHFDLTFDGMTLGSTGASTVYIESGNGVYWDNYTALSAAQIANYNLYGTHEFCMTVSTGPGWYENDPSDNTGCLTVNFEGPTAVTDHTITVLNTDNTVSPSGNIVVADGGSQTFTITPGACNTIADVLVDGSSVLSSVVNNTYTFTNVTSDHSFQVLYNTNSYSLTATTDGNGTITPPSVPSISCGSSQMFSITPHTGYVIDYVLDNSMDVTAQVTNNRYVLSNITTNHTIFVVFAPDASLTYTLTATTDGNGTVTPANTTVSAGANQTFVIVPDNGYVIDYVTDNTIDVTADVQNNTYTLSNITNDHDIYVAFVQSTTPTDTYTLIASTGGNGTITPTNVTVNAGDNQTFTIVPNSGYEIDYVTDNAIDVTASVQNNSYTLTNINADHTIFVAFVSTTPQVETYTLTATTDGNGTVTPTNVTVNAGDNQTFTITPNAGYEINYVMDNAVDVTASVQNNSYTLTNIMANHSIFVAFAQTTPQVDTYTLTATTDGNGTVTPANITVNAGDNQTFTITPNANYELLSLTDNGTDVTSAVANNTYTLTNIQSDHALYATFQETTIPVETYTVTVVIDGNNDNDVTVTPMNATVNAGDNLDIIIAPEPGYELSGLTDNGNQVDIYSSVVYSPIDTTYTYSLTNIQEDHVLHVALMEVEAVEENESAHIDMFPNPVSDLLHVRSNGMIEQIEIFDMAGKLVDHQSVNASDVEMNVSSFAPGMYMVKIISGETTSYVKMMKH